MYGIWRRSGRAGEGRPSALEMVRMRSEMKRIWLALWLLSQSLGFALPARPNVAGQDPPRRLAWEQNQGGHHGYDTGDQSCGIYAAELPSVTTENLIDRASAVPKSVGYDSCLVSTIRSVGGPRAPPAENFGSLAAKETPRVLTQAEQALYGRVTQTKGFRQQDGAGRRSGRSLGATSLIQGLGQGKATTYSCGGTNASVSTSIWFSNPTNASAAVTYDADGNVTSRAWTGTNAKSQVLEWDPFGLRQFDSSEGRFLSADPLGHSGSLSLYDYAYNDPVNWVDADGRFGKGIGVGARDMAVGFWDLFYNVGGSFEYAMTGDDAFAEQWAGLKGVGYGLAQLGSDLWNGNLGDVGRALTGGEGRSGGFRTGYGGFQIATFYLSGAKLGQLGRVGEVAEVGVNVTRAGEAGSALKVATQAFEKGGGWGYPRNALLSPNAEAGGIGAAAKTGLNPAEINFSQRTVSANVRQYADDMAAGNWDWSRSGPLRVMERDGQWVSYDNRRLMAAQQAGVGEVPIQVVQPGQLMPGSSLTWDQAFTRRFTDPRNVQAGGVVPNAGLSTQPSIAPPRR